MQTTYTAYLAEVRRLVLAECGSNSRFFSIDTACSGRSTWACGSTQSRVSTLQSTPTPIPIPVRVPAPPPAPVMQAPPVQRSSLNPVPKASLKEPAQAEVSATSPEAVSSSPPLSSFALPTASSTPPSLTPSRRLGLQPPIAIEPFPAGEWKTRLAQAMPSLKMHDVPPLPFGEQLWSSSEADWLVLFIEPSELSAASERFVLSIKTAAKVLFSSSLPPIGCLPMQQLTEHQLRPNCICMPLRDFEAYFKEPSRKKKLWEELEHLHAAAVQRITSLPPPSVDSASSIGPLS